MKNAEPGVTPAPSARPISPLTLRDTLPHRQPEYTFNTPKLWGRPIRDRDPDGEFAAMRFLANAVAADPTSVYQHCADAGLKLCRADSCGITVHERTVADEDIFRWVAVAGALKGPLHGALARQFSPGEICLGTDAPLLVERPELAYGYLNVGPPVEEALLIPLRGEPNGPNGAIWMMSHERGHKFDAEDARAMQRLSIFLVTIVRLSRIAEAALSNAASSSLQFRELDHRIKNTLQMSASILSRHLSAVLDPAARSAMQMARSRMHAMGLMHTVQSEAESTDLAEIVHHACADLFKGDMAYRVDVDAEIGLVLSPARSSILVLVINELVSNALKHAFKDRDTGTVTVELRRVSVDQLAIGVTDDGIPLQAAHVPGKRTGLGLKLVEGMAAQLGGELVVDAATKRFRVIFPG